MLIVGDFDGDGKADLFIFNGDDWSMSYLGMFRSTGTALQMVQRYDGDVPGWGGLARHDRFLAARISGDNRTDLFAWNYDDWAEEYLGRMISTGNGLRASFVGDWVGEWNLGGIDKFEVCNYQGLPGPAQSLRAQSGLVRNDPGSERADLAEDLLPLDPQLPLRPQLVNGGDNGDEGTADQADWRQRGRASTPQGPGQRRSTACNPVGQGTEGETVRRRSTEACGGTHHGASSDRRGGAPDLPEQQSARRAKTPAGYVRLRVRVEDGELAIVDSHMVEGPLAQTAAFEGGHAYEVTEGDRLLHAGSIPDLGVVRSFAHPTGTLEQQGHHTYERSTYEFNARVPIEALTRAALPKIAVVLYRVKERPPARAALAQPLSAPLDTARAREVREVGRVEGLPASVLGSKPTTPSGRRATPRRAKTRAAKRPARKR